MFSTGFSSKKKKENDTLRSEDCEAYKPGTKSPMQMVMERIWPKS
jgi:hypothetical protein